MLNRAIIAAVSMGASPVLAAGGATFEHVSCKGAPNEIRVTVEGVKKSQGLMTAELFRNDPENFLKKAGREFRVRFAARAPSTQFCVVAPSSGKYAIAVYHDENANLKFDKGAFGLPVEPYGVSGNPKIRLGPPPIEEALFEVAENGAVVEVKLKD